MKVKLTDEKKSTAKTLRGKTISRVYLYPFDPNREGSTTIQEIATAPVIVFTDGSRLHFVVEETECSEYGVHLSLHEKAGSVVKTKGCG